MYMGWKLTCQQQQDGNLERENLSAREERLQMNNNNNNRGRNALTDFCQWEVVLQRLGAQYSFHSQRNNISATAIQLMSG